jgi:hypothetical protein
MPIDLVPSIKESLLAIAKTLPGHAAGGAAVGGTYGAVSDPDQDQSRLGRVLKYTGLGGAAGLATGPIGMRAGEAVAERRMPAALKTAPKPKPHTGGEDMAEELARVEGNTKAESEHYAAKEKHTRPYREGGKALTSAAGGAGVVGLAEHNKKKDKTDKKKKEKKAAYQQGFIAKCAQYGVDPEELIKAAQILSK